MQPILNILDSHLYDNKIEKFTIDGSFIEDQSDDACISDCVVSSNE
jgi:hypothetical protein